MSTATGSSSNNNNNGGDQNRKPPGRTPQGENKCEYCQKGYARPDNLARHIKAEHEEAEPFRCPYCPAVSKRKDNLDKHVRNSHTEIECAFEDCEWKDLEDRYIQHVLDDHASEIGKRLYDRFKDAYDDEEDPGQGQGGASLGV